MGTHLDFVALLCRPSRLSALAFRQFGVLQSLGLLLQQSRGFLDCPADWLFIYLLADAGEHIAQVCSTKCSTVIHRLTTALRIS